jgi:hypothetical protein
MGYDCNHVTPSSVSSSNPRAQGPAEDPKTLVVPPPNTKVQCQPGRGTRLLAQHCSLHSLLGMGASRRTPLRGLVLVGQSRTEQSLPWPVLHSLDIPFPSHACLSVTQQPQSPAHGSRIGSHPPSSSRLNFPRSFHFQFFHTPGPSLCNKFYSLCPKAFRLGLGQRDCDIPKWDRTLVSRFQHPVTSWARGKPVVSQRNYCLARPPTPCTDTVNDL